MRAFRPTVAAVALASLVLAGCGGSDESGGGDDSGPKGVGDEQVLASTWPLTGLDVKKRENSSLDHPVLVAKIDNTANSSPQVGLSKADMVVEELVEGGMTRLAVFYYSQLPDQAGPIRSMRASDIGIVKPVNGEMVTSGAAGQTIGRLKGAGVKFHQEGQSPGFHRDGGRSGVYSVMANLNEVAKAAKGDEKRPDDYLPWGDADDLPKGQKATSLSANFGGHTTTWGFEDGRYVNKNTYAADDDQFLADSVLVLEVEVGDAGYLDPGGNPVPETKLEGSGPATLFHDGRAIRGTFQKKGLSGTITLKTKKGKLTVPAGHTWIELVPKGRGGVTFQ